MKTLNHTEITDADRPFECSVGHADGTVTLYYEGDELPSITVASPPACPESVTMRQARLALLGAGKLAAVATAIDALPEPHRTAAQITWEYSADVERHNGLVAQLGPALGLTDTQIDALFKAAAAL
jgi:hypothetical protein